MLREFHPLGILSFYASPIPDVLACDVLDSRCSNPRLNWVNYVPIRLQLIGGFWTGHGIPPARPWGQETRSFNHDFRVDSEAAKFHDVLRDRRSEDGFMWDLLFQDMAIAIHVLSHMFLLRRLFRFAAEYRS